MESAINIPVIWWLATILAYLVASYIGLSAENKYRKEFELPIVTWLSVLPSYLIGGVFLLVILYLKQGVIPDQSAVFYGLAGSALVGIYRVDRETLIIPDRLQILGLISGAGHVGVSVATGIDAQLLGMHLALALILVGILWLMSWGYFRLRGEIGFGFGDVKLLGWLALFVRFDMAHLILMSVGVGFSIILWKNIYKSIQSGALSLPGMRESFAFGPAIVWAVVILHLY